jgi:hypothetical protein
MVGYFSGLLWIAAQARRTLREFSALCKMHTMTEAKRKDFSLQRFLHVSSPLWLTSSVNYEPTPEELLTLLREHEQATEGQTRAIATTLNDIEDEEAKDEQEESPAISMFLTITSSLSLSLLVPGHDSMPVKLPEAAASLIGFLATRTRGLWTTTDAVAHIAQLYGWLAMVGVRLDIKDGGRSSEHDMECCLNYYSNVQQVSAAQATYRKYCKLRSRVDPTYELGNALEARAQEVFSSIRKTARSRKNEKDVL